MTARGPSSRLRKDSYTHQATRPMNALIFLLVPLAFYHVIAAMYGTRLAAPRLLEWALAALGAPPVYTAPLLVIVLLAVQHLAERETWKFKPVVFLGMAAESVLFAVPLLAWSFFVGAIFSSPAPAAAAAGPDSALTGALRSAAQAVGAGIYEELLFRMLFLGVVSLLFVDVLGLKPKPVSAGAVWVGGVLFAMMHFDFTGLGGQQVFRWGYFVFLAGAGVYWGALYFARGYGIAAGSHIAWDLFALLLARPVHAG